MLDDRSLEARRVAQIRYGLAMEAARQARTLRAWVRAVLVRGVARGRL